jgi:cell division protein FtsW
MSLFARTDRSMLGQWWWTIDRGLLGCFILLMIVGVMMVATASPPVAENHNLGSYHFLIRHIIILVPSFAMMVGISMLDMRSIWRVASILFLISIFSMILVPFIGIEIKGAQRWIHLPGFSFQPSEFAKPAFAIVGAWFMSIQKTRAGFPGYVITAVLYAVTVALLLMQPDFGMTFVITAIWASMIFLAGFPFRLLTGLAALAVGGVFAVYHTFDHVRSRIDRFFNPDSGDNYQVDKSIEAFQNGGLFGTGPGQGTVKLGLPDAHADFIFSVAGEEMGLIFVLILIAVFGYVLLRTFNRLMDSDNMFVVLAVGGLLTMFGLQAMVHMGSSLNILPAKGMTLPFISYGGSSLLSMSFSMGAVLALTRRQTRSSVSKGGLSLRPRSKAAKNAV